MKEIKLDGRNTGFFVEVNPGEGEKKFISTSNGIRIFDNLEIAKITANRFSSGCRFKYYIKLDENNIVELNDTQQMNDGSYQVVTNSGIVSVKEKRSYTTTKIGYVVFDDGDTVRIDKQLGFVRQKDLYGIIKWAFEVLLLNYTGDFGLVSVTKKPGEIVGSIAGTTSKIHIVKCSRLMEINMERKNNNKRVFPFIKEMDKFTTFYIYTTKDVSESKNLRGNERIESIFERFFNLIQREFPALNCKFVPANYSGYIEVED